MIVRPVVTIKGKQVILTVGDENKIIPPIENTTNYRQFGLKKEDSSGSMAFFFKFGVRKKLFERMDGTKVILEPAPFKNDEVRRFHKFQEPPDYQAGYATLFLLKTQPSIRTSSRIVNNYFSPPDDLIPTGDINPSSNAPTAKIPCSTFKTSPIVVKAGGTADYVRNLNTGKDRQNTWHIHDTFTNENKVYEAASKYNKNKRMIIKDGNKYTVLYRGKQTRAAKNLVIELAGNTTKIEPPITNKLPPKPTPDVSKKTEAIKQAKVSKNIITGSALGKTPSEQVDAIGEMANVPQGPAAPDKIEVPDANLIKPAPSIVPAPVTPAKKEDEESPDTGTAELIKKMIQEQLTELKITERRQPEKNNRQSIRIPSPFNMCFLGEAVDKNLLRERLGKYFEIYRVRVTDWNIEYYNNSRLKNTDVLRILRRGQTRFKLIIIGQIYHHSGRGNKSANILTEIKNDTKYIDHIVCLPPEKIPSLDAIIDVLDKYIRQNFLAS